MPVALPGFTVIRLLGEGSTGAVLLARHEDSGDMVAIKYLRPELAHDPAFLEAFRVEATVLESLRHPNIVRLLNYAEMQGQAILVLELVQGVALRELIDLGSTTPQAALSVLKGSLLGLGFAHRAGIIHRDYKPDNVLIADDGVSKLLDFGVALPSGSPSRSAGSPGYMAPEQWTDGSISPATDVYSAAVTFFECLTGRRPYESDDLVAMRLQHENASIPAEQVPGGLRRLLRKGMAKQAADRYQSADEFLGELEEDAQREYGIQWEQLGLATLGGAVGIMAALLPLAPATAGAGAGAVQIGTTLTETSLTPVAVAAPPALPPAPAASSPPATAAVAAPPRPVAPPAPAHARPAAPAPRPAPPRPAPAAPAAPPPIPAALSAPARCVIVLLSGLIIGAAAALVVSLQSGTSSAQQPAATVIVVPASPVASPAVSPAATLAPQIDPSTSP